MQIGKTLAVSFKFIHNLDKLRLFWKIFMGSIIALILFVLVVYGLLSIYEDEQKRVAEQKRQEEQQKRVAEQKRQEEQQQRQAEQRRQAEQKRQEEEELNRAKHEILLLLDKIEKLLASGKWEEANYETAYIYRNPIIHKALNILNQEDVKTGRFDHTVASEGGRIDQLWVKYSGGRFGFSVQRKLQTEGMSFNDYLNHNGLSVFEWEEIELRQYENGSVGEEAKEQCQYQRNSFFDYQRRVFHDKIGWQNIREYNDIIFNLQAPVGHLPFIHIYLENGTLKIDNSYFNFSFVDSSFMRKQRLYLYRNEK